MIDSVLLLIGFALLIVGGDYLVRGSVNLASAMGMSKLLIGITLVGFATSSPELVTSLQASFAGSPGIAIGNFVGSNISNILLIVGTSALILPLAVSRRSLNRDGMVVLGSAIAFAVVAFALPYNQVVGGLFVTALIGYLTLAYRTEMSRTRNIAQITASKTTAAIEGPDDGEADDGGIEIENMSRGVALAMTFGGLVAIIIGGKCLVDGAIGIARTFGISEAVIGLTIVAVGTSMPELVTSVIAALRNHADVAVGNVLGSNIYNTLGIGGVVALIAPTEIPEQIITYDNLIMLAATVALLAFAYTRGRVGRLEGGLLLAAYVAYLASLWPQNLA